MAAYTKQEWIDYPNPGYSTVTKARMDHIEGGIEAAQAAADSALAGGGGGGVTDHGLLTGLADDDHPQYHNDTRGDARYYTKSQSDTLLTGKADSTHTHTASQVSDSTTTGRAVVTAVDAAAARTAIGAGTSNLALGTTSTTAAPGDHTHTQSLNAQTGTTYTLVAGDAGKLVTLNNAAAITLTVPSGVFTAGQRIDFLVLGAGMVTVVGSATTVNGTPSLVTRAQYSAASVVCVAANTFVVVGDLA